MERLIKLVREMTGIKEDVEIRDFEIRRSCSPLVIEPVSISVELRIREPQEKKLEQDPPRPLFTPIDQVKPRVVIVKNKPGRKPGPRPKAQDESPAVSATRTGMTLSKKDRLDPGRTFTTSEDDVKLARVYLYNWMRYPGMVSEDQQRALRSTAGVFFKSMSEASRKQIISIFNDVRKKRGLIQ